MLQKAKQNCALSLWIDESHRNVRKAILANPEGIDGLYFEHTWLLMK